jgi:hypothetical protein
MHGYDQSQAHLEASQAYSAALARSRKLEEVLGFENMSTRKARMEASVKKQELRKAYLAYTNPLNIKKTFA